MRFQQKTRRVLIIKQLTQEGALEDQVAVGRIRITTLPGVSANDANWLCLLTVSRRDTICPMTFPPSR